MDNPVLEARRSVQLSQAQFGQALSNPLSPTYIANLEAGMVSTIPPRLYDDLTKLLRSALSELGLTRNVIKKFTGQSYEHFESMYQHSRVVERSKTGLRLARVRVNFGSLSASSYEHPHAAFRRLVIGTNMRQFSRLMCVNPELVVSWEKSGLPNSPSELREAYYDAGLDQSFQSVLDELLVWRAKFRKGRTSGEK